MYKATEMISTKLGGGTGPWPGKNPFNLVVDVAEGEDPGMSFLTLFKIFVNFSQNNALILVFKKIRDIFRFLKMICSNNF